jgi:hypothetical protein
VRFSGMVGTPSVSDRAEVSATTDPLWPSSCLSPMETTLVASLGLLRTKGFCGLDAGGEQL